MGKHSQVKNRTVKKAVQVNHTPGIYFWPKMGIIAIVFIALLLIGVLYNFNVIGKAITQPSPTVDLTVKGSEELDLSAYNKMDVKIKLSEGSTLNLTVNITTTKEMLTYYQLYKLDKKSEKTVVASGILGKGLTSSGEIYLDNDDEGDLELNLQWPLLTVNNLNFIEPATADIEVYDAKFNKIGKDILFADLNKKTLYYFNVTSTSQPNVTAMVDNKPADLKKEESGKDYALVSLTFQPVEAKPSEVIITADVQGKKTTKKYLLAAGGQIYNLNREGYPKISLKKKGDKYEVSYVFSKTQELQPVALLCGEVNIKNHSAAIEKIYSYLEKVEQWKENVPSDFGNLGANKGYFFELKKNAVLNFTVICNEEPSAKIPKLSEGWNLIGVSGYQPVPIEDLVLSTGKITRIQEYNKNINLEITELEPGLVYWIKVE